MSPITRRPVFALLTLGCSLVSSGQVSLRKDPVLFQASPDDLVRASRAGLPPVSQRVQLNAPGRFRLNSLSANEAAKIGVVHGNRRIGLHRDLPSTAVRTGTWTTLGDGSRVWRLAIGSPAASGVRVHFTDFSIGKGQVWLYAEGAAEADGPYTAEGPYGNGDFWSATISAENVVVEYAAPAGVTGDAVPFRVRQLSHQAALVDAEIEAGYAAQARAADLAANSPAPLSTFTLDLALATANASSTASNNRGKVSTDPAATCNADLNCYPDWANAKRSVAHLQFEETLGDEPGTYVCSGALVATRDNSLKPYLLTAGHCIHDEPAARSLQVWWAYESAGCNLGVPASHGVLKSTPGGHLLGWGTVPKGDYSLVLLTDVPSGTVFAGWDPTDPTLGTNVIGIHHPMGSYKRISFGHTVISQTVTVQGEGTAPAELYTTTRWDRGLTEPGSSGSPLFTGPGVIVGMDSYGPAGNGETFCIIGESDGYAKFSNAYKYLSDYLENLPATQVKASATALKFSGLNRQIAGNNSQSVTLTVGTASKVAVGVRPDAPWIVVSTESSQISASSPLELRVSADPKYIYDAGRYTGTITILSGAADPQYINVTLDMQIEQSNVSAAISPSPIPQEDGIWTFKVRLTETAGTDTRLTGLRIDGDDYSAQIATWFSDGSLPAKGAIEGTLHARGLFAPIDKYFEFFGADTVTGRQWYRTATVTFLP